MVKDALCLTDIRERKWGICHFVSERVLVAFGAVMVADCLIMTPKAFPTKAAFVIANPKAGRAAVRHEGVHAFKSRPAGRDVEHVLTVSSTAFFWSADCPNPQRVASQTRLEQSPAPRFGAAAASWDNSRSGQMRTRPNISRRRRRGGMAR